MSSGSEKTRVPGEPTPPKLGGHGAAVSSMPPPSTVDPAPERDSQATIISNSPFRADSDPPAAEKGHRGSAQPTVVGARPGSGEAHKVVSGDDTLPPGTPPARRSPRPEEAIGQTGSAVLLRIGTVLGSRYEILELLGEGGMGAVYKAADREVDRIVALKVIRPEMASNPEILARFKQELLLAHQVTHRNVIRIYDLGEAEGLKFITMEFIEGKDLRSLIREKAKFTPEEAVDVIQQVCQALDAAHSVGIIHRDLKPQNIMQDGTGRILVMDFGLARTLEGDGMTQTGAIVGTMEYMSPEQALAKELDQRSDVFALGLIF